MHRVFMQQRLPERRPVPCRGGRRPRGDLLAASYVGQADLPWVLSRLRKSDSTEADLQPDQSPNGKPIGFASISSIT